MQNTKSMSGKSGFHPCMACNVNIPQKDKHTLCARCLGIQHATLALKREVACSICAAFQPRVKENRLERATKASSASSVAGPSTALRAKEPLLHDLSQDPLLDIPMHRPPVVAPHLRRREGGDQGGWEEASQQEDTLSIAASGDGASLSSDMQPSCRSPGGQRQNHAGVAPRPQKFLAFPEFMEEVCSSWDRLASSPSVLKQAAPHTSLEGAEKLGTAGFPPVDSTIAALVKAPPVGGLARDLACLNPQCRVMETHLKRAYAAEAQTTRLSNMASVLTVYMDSVLRKAPLPEPVATELRLEKVRLQEASVLLVEPRWTRRIWFSTLCQLLHWEIPLRMDLLSQTRGTLWHPKVGRFRLWVWPLKGTAG
ncbi:UNVERIFIED_CONTAM: hypothetical protein FKN15_077968 [Acipenser sinensis]